MTPPVPSRRRRAAVIVAFIVGVVATAATGSSYASIEVASSGGTLTLDGDHPAFVSRMVLNVNAEATSGNPNYDISIILGRASSPGATYGTVDPALVRVIVTSSPPVAVPTTNPPSASPGLETSESGTQTSDAWQADLTATHAAVLPIDCGQGPCERVFWVLAALTGEASGEVDVQWGLQGTIGWSAGAAPSAAAASATIDPPIALAVPASALTASTDAETIQFGPDRPTAARVVEVTADAATIRSDGGPTAALTVAVAREWAYDPADNFADSTSLLVEVYPLDGPLATSGGAGAMSSGPAGSLPPGSVVLPSGSAAPNASSPSNVSSRSVPAALPPGGDPFVGCHAGSPCTRRFLVSLALTRAGYMPADTSGKPRPFQWQLTLRRTDLVRAWASPGTMTARVTRSFDIAAGVAPLTAHLEGDMLVPANDPSTSTVVIATSTTSADPIARLLPVPAAMTLRVPLPAAWPDPKETVLQVTPQMPGSAFSAYFGQPTDGSMVVIGSPSVASDAACRVGSECSKLEIFVRMLGQPPSQVSYHWSLDIAFYSYSDVPVALTARPASP